MRTRISTLLCRLKQIHNKETRPISTWLSSSSSCSRVPDSRWSDAALEKSQIGSVRFMGVGSFKEGNRAGQHGVIYPHAKADGSPEKQEADAREQFLEKAKAESADETSGQGGTELQFGVEDGKSTDEAITHSSEELISRSFMNAQRSEPEEIKGEDKQTYAGVSINEDRSWASSQEKEAGETKSGHARDKVDVQGRETESVTEGNIEAGKPRSPQAE